MSLMDNVGERYGRLLFLEKLFSTVHFAVLLSNRDYIDNVIKIVISKLH